MKEKFKQEIEKLKKMNFRQKMQYIWEYYKVGILIFIFAAVFIGMFIHDTGKNNPDAVHIAMCDMLPAGILSDGADDEIAAEEKINNTFIAYTKMEAPKKLPLSIDTSYSLNISDDYMSTMMRQKLIAALGAQMIDVMIGPENGMEDCSKMNVFLDIREYLSEDTVSDLEAKDLICKTTITPDTEDGGEPFEVYYGIKADGMTALTDAGYIADGCVAAITGTPDKLGNAIKVMEMLINCLP